MACQHAHDLNPWRLSTDTERRLLGWGSGSPAGAPPGFRLVLAPQRTYCQDESCYSTGEGT